VLGPEGRSVIARIPKGAPVTGSDADILHIATPDAWNEAQRTGTIAPASLRSEGFVHCSTRAQLTGTLARHFAGAGTLLGLVLDPRAVADDLRWDESHPSERFPHVYGPIPVTAVVAIERLDAPAG
jgi:uncharacterized protein (DUF952 family)